jgi:hypothetical protein
MIEPWPMVLVLILIGVNVLQFLYWSRIQNDLIDKLLSKNYPDYVIAKNYPKTLEREKVKTDDDQKEIEAQNAQVLAELNGMLGR